MQFDAKTSDYFLELLRCALHGKPVSQKPQDVSWTDLFAFAKDQSLSYMAYSAISKCGFKLGDALEQEWTMRNSLNIVTYFNQEHECERLCSAFAREGIRCMPLKGSVIRKLFPSPEMREMCDLDIWVQPEDTERVHAMMLADGYTYVEDHTTSHNREYHKMPYLNVEIHHYLVPQESEMFSYYADFWKNAICDDDGGLICRMAWDDAYIYMMAHAHKHFFRQGTGIRSVMDVFVMRDRLKDVLDHEHIVNELKKLEIYDFADRFERLADCWFGEVRTEIPQDLLAYQYRVLESGTYGDDDFMKGRALKYMQDGKSFQSAKRTLAITKLFPPYSYMKMMYPCLKYVPFLLPLFWIIRWISTLIVKPKKISGFFRKLRHLSLSDDKEERR